MTISLFDNCDKLILNEYSADSAYEQYKGIVLDPKKNKFSVIEGPYRDKKDFYEKMFDKGLVTRKVFEKKVFDWIEENAKSNIDAYLLMSTAFSKWRNNNALSHYYIKLLKDIPQLNREKIKGNPDTMKMDDRLKPDLHEDVTPDGKVVLPFVNKDNMKTYKVEFYPYNRKEKTIEGDKFTFECKFFPETLYAEYNKKNNKKRLDSPYFYDYMYNFYNFMYGSAPEGFENFDKPGVNAAIYYIKDRFTGMDIIPGGVIIDKSAIINQYEQKVANSNHYYDKLNEPKNLSIDNSTDINRKSNNPRYMKAMHDIRSTVFDTEDIKNLRLLIIDIYYDIIAVKNNLETQLNSYNKESEGYKDIEKKYKTFNTLLDKINETYNDFCGNEKFSREVYDNVELNINRIEEVNEKFNFLSEEKLTKAKEYFENGNEIINWADEEFKKYDSDLRNDTIARTTFSYVKYLDPTQKERYLKLKDTITKVHKNEPIEIKGKLTNLKGKEKREYLEKANKELTELEDISRYRYEKTYRYNTINRVDKEGDAIAFSLQQSQDINGGNGFNSLVNNVAYDMSNKDRLGIKGDISRPVNKPDPKVIGKISAIPYYFELDGKIVKSISEYNKVPVKKDDIILDFDGNEIGKVNDDNIIISGKKVVGYVKDYNAFGISESEPVSISIGTGRKNNIKYACKKNDNGKIRIYGTIKNSFVYMHGGKIYGVIYNNKLYASNDKIIGMPQKYKKIVLTDDGKKIGYVDFDGNAYNVNGKIIGKGKPNGKTVSSGKSVTLKTNPITSQSIDVHDIPKEELDKIRSDVKNKKQSEKEDNVISDSVIYDNFGANSLADIAQNPSEGRTTMLAPKGTIVEDKTESELNSELFDGEVLKSDVRLALLKIANTFKKTLDLPFDYIDVYLTGSNANYNYTENSDIDLHLVYNYEQAGISAEILSKYLILAKSLFNMKYDITVKGIDVEVGCENITSPLVSTGIYSIINNTWVRMPKNKDKEIPNINTDIYNKYIGKIVKAIDSKNLKKIKNVKELVSDLRKTGLRDGEFGDGNLLYKKLRDNNYIKKLRDVYYDTLGDELSLESVEVK